ncbi:putative MFS family arabinose efflux permease [Kibdelosporangium banguiense]|uniref:MFS family arabinose efflux permease n=1 Tax=Kibdelosporangium banguiense TaxID=1365924 RepID=A0ABS4TEA5_9PSEU|nr:MFS transporter [Kibdelosporangium banguiense]MBP2322684.1 putative MFS family arabinose efflux permease [Kibdelosporangium banguiense]
MTLRNYLLATGTFAAGTSSQIIAGVLPDLAHEQNVSVATAGQLLTAFALTYAVSSPLLAAATGRWERRKLLVTAMMVMALGNALGAIAPNYATLFVARMITALGAAVYTPSATVVAAELNPPERRARAIATIFGGLTVAMVIGIPLSSLLAGPLGYRGVFGVVAALIAVAAVSVWLVVPQVAAPPPVGLRDRLAVAADRRVLAMLVVTLLISVAGLSVYTYLTPLLNDVAGVHGATVSLLLFAYGLGGVLGNSVGGLVTDRFGSRAPLIWALAGCAVTMALLPVVASVVVGAIVILVLWGMANWSINPPMQSRLVDLAPDTAGLVLAMNASAIYLGVGLSGVTGGLVIEFSGTPALGPVAAVIAVAALVVFVVATRPQSSFAGSTTQSGPGNTSPS